MNASREHGREAEQIQLHHGNFCIPLLEDYRAGGELSLLARRRRARSNTSRNRQ